MAIATFNADLASAHDCKFCGSSFLFFGEGCVICDRCQCEGPFCDWSKADTDWQIEAVRLWNLTPDDDWDDE